MRTIIIILSALISFQSLAQDIGGKVIDEKREPMVSAVIQVYTGGILKGGTVTDYDGYFVIKPLDPGYYDVLVTHTGYDSMFTIRVLVSPDARTVVNFALSRINGQPKNIIKEFKRPLVQVNETQSREFRDETRSLPGCGPTDLVWSQVGVYQAQRGTNVNIGGRGTLYVIDGVQLPDNIGIAQCCCFCSEIPDFSSTTYTFTRERLSRLIYRDINDLTKLIPGNTQYGFENSRQYDNINAIGYSYIVDGMHLLNRY